MLIFVVLMFVALPFVIFSAIFPRQLRTNLIYTIATIWSDVGMFLWGMWHKNIYRMPVDSDKPFIYVFNHISYLDIPILLKAFRSKKIRVLGKAEIGAIPIFGYIYRSATITVKRSDADDRAKSVATLKEALSHNISIVLAPEGTFNMTHRPLKNFYDGAFKIAIDTRTAIQPVIFLDAYDRLHYDSVFSFTPGKSRAVFLEPVEINDCKNEDLQELKQQVYSSMENALLEYKASWIKN